MNILIAGSSGLIGTALQRHLESRGHSVYRLLRGQSPHAEFSWDPLPGQIQFSDAVDVDVVINLNGASLGDGRWSEQKKGQIFWSRVDTTRLLADTLANMATKPRVFVSASAIGFYGNQGARWVDERSPAGTDFLADLALQWEKASQAAADAGIRTVNIRTGLVLSPEGGALQRMLTPFRFGLGGVIGNGEQFMSWVSIDEITRMIEFVIDTESISGPVNLVSPEPATNRDFTRALGKALRRPTIAPLPAFMARLMFGEMADLLLLSSTRVKPKKLADAGFEFDDRDLEATFRTLLNG